MDYAFNMQLITVVILACKTWNPAGVYTVLQPFRAVVQRAFSFVLFIMTQDCIHVLLLE